MSPNNRATVALSIAFSAALAVTVGFAGTSSAATTADPAGTVAVNATGTERPDLAVLGASSAGVLYEVNGESTGGSPARAIWVKPTGAAAYQVDVMYGRLAGKNVYWADGPTVHYIDIATGQAKTCSGVPAPALASAAAPNGPFTPFGYLAKNGQRVEVDATGCSVITTGPALPAFADYTLAAADANGYVTAATPGAEQQPLTYRAYASPSQPKPIAMMGHDSYSTAFDLAGGFVSWAEVLSSTESWVMRAPISGAAGTATKVARQVQTTSVIPTATGWSTCGSVGSGLCTSGSIVNGKVTELRGSFSVKGLGDKFVLDTYRDQPAIDTTTVVDGTTWSTRITTVPLLRPVSWGVAVGPGAVTYADSQGERTLSRKSVTRSGSTIGLGRQVTVGPVASSSPIARDGRRTAYLNQNGVLQVITDDGVRTTIFTPQTKVATVTSTADAFDMSGNRLLWVKGLYTGEKCGPEGCYDSYDNEHLMIYDLNTGKTTESTYAKGTKPAAIWGSYLVYGTATNQVMRRDLYTGATVQIKGAGSALAALDVAYQYVAWATCSNTPVTDCGTSRVGYKIAFTGVTAEQASSNTERVRVNGARIYFDSRNAADETRLYQWPVGGSSSEIARAVSTRQFDVYDETLAWLSTDRVVKLAPLPAFTASPVYLGGASGGNTVKSGATWRPEYPISKPLPSCTMTIKHGTTVVRTLICPTTVGVARPVWNTKNTAGKLVAKGTYSWALTGSDSDGTLKRWDGPVPVTGTVTVN